MLFIRTTAMGIAGIGLTVRAAKPTTVVKAVTLTGTTTSSRVLET